VQFVLGGSKWSVEAQSKLGIGFAFLLKLYLLYKQNRPELSMGWVDPLIGLGWFGLGWVWSRFFSFW